MSIKINFKDKYHFSLACFFFLSLLILILLSVHCRNKPENIIFNKEKTGVLSFAYQKIALRVHPSTKIEVTFKKEGKELSLLVPSSKRKTIPHYLVVDNEKVDDFELLPDSVNLESIKTDFGKGKQLTFKANASGPKSSTIEKELKVTLFEKYPDFAMVQASYKNIASDKPITITRIYNNTFQLDRKQVNSDKLSYDFWSFLGYGKILGGRHDNIRVNVLVIDKDLDVQNDSEIISGVPLVDIWSPEMGFAIASIENRARILKMPVKVDENGFVNIGLEEKPEIELNPGESYTALKTVIIVHSLDYYDPLQRWSHIMADQGIKFKTCPEFGYDPFWCNWGYRKDWNLSHGLDRLDEFKALGIKAVTIDDGWFEYYGDWSPSPNRFPAGDRQLKEWVDQLHAKGLKAVLWWVPCIGGPETIEKHPDWIIKDKDGNPHSIHWEDSQMLCPALPKVIQYYKDLTRKFIEAYGFDGFKLDGIYVAPRCYNPAHNHGSPDESYSAYEDVFKAIYETAMELKPKGDFVLGMCPCGALCSPYYLQWGNRPVAADPPLMTISTRHRVKAYKALLGPTSCVDNDFHERYNDYFPVEFGCGGLMTTKYTRLSDYEFGEFKKWYGLYNKYRLSSGEYLNLYDVAYDVPETYVIKKDDSYFYTFLKPGINGPEGVPWFEDQIDKRTEMLKAFTEELEQLPVWQGIVELRGLKEHKYSVFNLETNEKLGQVNGPIGKLMVSFKDHLIGRAVPE